MPIKNLSRAVARDKKFSFLVFDLGNTACHFGFFKKGRLVKQWRIPTPGIFSLKKLSLPMADFCLGCSVVPKLDKKLKKLIKPAPLFINHKNIPYIKAAILKPGEVGADRLVNALAVFKKYRRPAIIIDVGTAITIDIVDTAGRYLGGVIFPGPALGAEALARRTAKLPLVSLKKPAGLIGRRTEECIRSGLYYGIADLITGVVARIKKEYPRRNFIVIGTGGGFEFLGRALDQRIKKEPGLTLEGLYLAGRELVS